MTKYPVRCPFRVVGIPAQTSWIDRKPHTCHSCAHRKGARPARRAAVGSQSRGIVGLASWCAELRPSHSSRPACYPSLWLALSASRWPMWGFCLLGGVDGLPLPYPLLVQLFSPSQCLIRVRKKKRKKRRRKKNMTSAWSVLSVPTFFPSSKTARLLLKLMFVFSLKRLSPIIIPGLFAQSARHTSSSQTLFCLCEVWGRII